MNFLFQVQLVMVHVLPRLAMCQQRSKWDIWEGENRPVITRRFVPLTYQEPGSVDVGSHERSRVMLEQAFDDGNNEFKWGYFRFGSLWVPHLLTWLDHFAVDPAITPVRATGHQLVTLCRSVCTEERAQILDPLMGSKYLTMCWYSFLGFFSSQYFLVNRIRCRSSAFGAECCTSWSTCCWREWLESRWIRGKCGQNALSRWKRCGGERSGSVLVTGATDAAGKQSHFYCRVCRKDVSVLTDGPHEILPHYQGVKHFAREQRLRLETPGWRVLDFEGNPFSESELGWQKEHILRGPLVVRDREDPFADDLIVDESEAPDETLPVVAKVSSLIEILRLGGPYELVNQLWSQFTLIASRVNIDVAWSRDKVLVGIVLLLVATYTWSLAYWWCVLDNHLEWNVPPHTCSCFWLWRVMGSAASSSKNAFQRSGS